MENSILKSTKKVLGLDAAYTAFDADVILHVNAAFSTLEQLGVGPAIGFMIEDDISVWDEFTDDIRQQNMVRSYVFLKVKYLFDPPGNAYLVDAQEKQIQEFEVRLSIRREGEEWVSSETENEDE